MTILYIFGPRTLVVDFEIFYLKKEIDIFLKIYMFRATKKYKIVQPKNYPNTIFVTHRTNPPKKTASKSYETTIKNKISGGLKFYIFQL